MTSDLNGVAEYVSETAEGHTTIIAALVMTLHKVGTLPLDTFRENLNQIRNSMPEDEAACETGAVIDRMIDFLDSDACSNPPAIGGALSSEKTSDAEKPIREDGAPVAPISRFTRIVQSTFGTTSRPWGGASGSTKHGSFRTAIAGRM